MYAQMAIVSIQVHFHRDLCDPNRCLQVKSLISVAWNSTKVTSYPKKHNRKVKEWSKTIGDFSFR